MASGNSRDDVSGIDDGLYSRQRYVLGDSAMHRMARSSVFLHTVNGLGVEIAKNLILAGVKSVTIDDATPCSVTDLGSQFYVRPEDIGKPRDSACLPRLAELNPYVDVRCSHSNLTINNLFILSGYTCVVVCNSSLSLQRAVDSFCRKNSIHLVCASVYGLAGSIFVDLGDEFLVSDADGEEIEPKFISSIDNQGVVTTHADGLHGLDTGDVITFREVVTSLNGKQFTVNVLTPSTFKVDAPLPMPEYTAGGVFIKVKQPIKISFTSLDNQLINPEILIGDLLNPDAPINVHVGFLALDRYTELHGELPSSSGELDEFLALCESANSSLTRPTQLDSGLLRSLAVTSSGFLQPLGACLGGFVAQEVLKSLTGKFSPLRQLFYSEFLCLAPPEVSLPASPDRYSDLRRCVGQQTLDQLHSVNSFMVGCGAIGCELLKNFAHIGLSTVGRLTITDNDIIEKSNLNRQFLFRSQHIRHPKSSTAATVAKQINPELNVSAHQHRVGPETEVVVYPDAFYADLDVVVNALDNVEARRYVDSRCVTNQRALLDSGTIGTKGHVQTVVPFLTESYGSQHDPSTDLAIPYCTLKSFPSTVTHTIEWARDKFESAFVLKPTSFNKLWTSYNWSTSGLLSALSSNQPTPDGLSDSIKLLSRRPADLVGCVKLARIKFEKYFTHKALNLLHCFPLDCAVADGTPFWTLPRRPPTPIRFDPELPDHLAFVASLARLWADVYGLRGAPFDKPAILAALEGFPVPEFEPSGKSVVTDEAATAPVEEEEDLFDVRLNLEGIESPSVKPLFPVDFEKDDDSNGHFDFITAASNLRASMYGIEPADRLQTKRIAGRIVPAIATTTACVAGLVTIELIKLAKRSLSEDDIGRYRNTFINLALPIVISSEPGAVPRQECVPGIEYTMWDRWDFGVSPSLTLQEFMKLIVARVGRPNLEVTSVIHGVKMVFMDFMPAHAARKKKQLKSLIKLASNQNYADLQVTMDTDDGAGDDINCPPIRVFFN